MKELLTIDFLDKTLLYLKAEGKFHDGDIDTPELSEVERRLMPRALQKLEKDGYLTSSLTKSEHNQTRTFYMTFEGLLALEKKSFFRPRYQPYRNQYITQKIKDAYTIAKVIIIALNSIAILYLMWLAIPAK